MAHGLGLNLPMASPPLHYRPNLDPAEIGDRLGRLLVQGRISDNDLEHRIARIGERFRVYSTSAPHGPMAPGHAVSPEMRLSAEVYLPLEEIRRAFNRLLSLSLRYTPILLPALLQNSLCWFDIVQDLHPLVTSLNPAGILRQLMSDGEFRCRVLFSLFLPRHYGGSFNRYPGQAQFLRTWLAKCRRTGIIRCLDAACGCGEGTYGLARLLGEGGYAPGKMVVHGATVEPLELFAAAHGWFPHDPARQKAFRAVIAPLVEDAAAERFMFHQEDLIGIDQRDTGRYDLILCNGLLGGPLINSGSELETAVERLCARLRPGGMLLAADRFHGGWKKTVPDERIKELMARHGLEMLTVDEGMAGVQQGLGTRNQGLEVSSESVFTNHQSPITAVKTG